MNKNNHHSTKIKLSVQNFVKFPFLLLLRFIIIAKLFYILQFDKIMNILPQNLEKLIRNFRLAQL